MSESPKRFCAIRKYRDGSEVVEEYFSSVELALQWIATQKSGDGKGWIWCVGEWS